MARLTAEQYAAQLRYLRYQDGLRLPNSGLGERDQFALDAHECAEAAEKRLSNLPDCPSCNGRGGWGSGGTDINTGEWMGEGCEDCGMSGKSGMWPEAATELADLRQRLAAADEENALLRGKLSQAEAALSDPKNELAGAMMEAHKDVMRDQNDPEAIPEAIYVLNLHGMKAALAVVRDALTPPAEEESGGVLHFAHARHISPAKEEG